jgi:hypothetical protein
MSVSFNLLRALEFKLAVLTYRVLHGLVLHCLCDVL